MWLMGVFLAGKKKNPRNENNDKCLEIFHRNRGGYLCCLVFMEISDEVSILQTDQEDARFVQYQRVFISESRGFGFISCLDAGRTASHRPG